MQDRIANHPNRWVLTPVTGETDTYDFTRADDPTQVGTPLNKATFLPDAVASAVESATGVSGITLPADALDALASAVDTIGLANNCKLAVGTYTGAGGTSTSTAVTLNFPFKPRFLIVGQISDSNSNYYLYHGGTYQIMWMYPYPKMENRNIVTYNNDTSISWVNESSTASDRPANRMDTSGTTYYYLAMGVE